MAKTFIVIKGLLAVLIGTIVMTLSQMLEIRLTGREPSTVPGQVGSKLFSLSPKNEHEMASHLIQSIGLMA